MNLFLFFFFFERSVIYFSEEEERHSFLWLQEGEGRRWPDADGKNALRRGFRAIFFQTSAAENDQKCVGRFGDASFICMLQGQPHLGQRVCMRVLCSRSGRSHTSLGVHVCEVIIFTARRCSFGVPPAAMVHILKPDDFQSPPPT